MVLFNVAVKFSIRKHHGRPALLSLLFTHDVALLLSGGEIPIGCTALLESQQMGRGVPLKLDYSCFAVHSDSVRINGGVTGSYLFCQIRINLLFVGVKSDSQNLILTNRHWTELTLE